MGKKLTVKANVAEDIMATHTHEWIKNSETGKKYCEKCGEWSSVDYVLSSNVYEILTGTYSDIYFYLETSAKVNSGFELKNLIYIA